LLVARPALRQALRRRMIERTNVDDQRARRVGRAVPVVVGADELLIPGPTEAVLGVRGRMHAGETATLADEVFHRRLLRGVEDVVGGVQEEYGLKRVEPVVGEDRGVFAGRDLEV